MADFLADSDLDADAGDVAFSAPLVGGRWRVPYDGDPVMVCVGSRGPATVGRRRYEVSATRSRSATPRS